MHVCACLSVVDPKIYSNFEETLVVMIYKSNNFEFWSNPF